MKRSTQRKLENTFMGVFKSVIVLQALTLSCAMGFLIFKLIETIIS